MNLKGRDLPNFRVTMTAVMLAFCTSINNGYISSVLNIPQFVVQDFVNASYEAETDHYLGVMKESYVWSGIVTQRQLGQFVGTVSTPILTGRLGRKGAIMFNSFVLSIGLLLQFASFPANIWALLLVGRFVWGCGCGIIAVLMPMFLSEIAPQRFMGAIASLHGMALGFGSLLADSMGMPMVLGTYRKWCWEYIIMVGLQVIQFIIFGLYCPESPKDLYVRQNKIDKAIKAIRFYQSPTEAELDIILEKFQQEKNQYHHGSQYLRLLKNRRLRMSILVGVGATCCYAFGAMQIVTNYSTVILTHVGAPYTMAMYVSLGIGALRFLSVFPSMYIVERSGRRKLLLCSLWGCIISFLAFLIAYAAAAANPSQAHAWQAVVATFLLFYGVAFSIGCQTIGTFLPSELVPTSDRSANQSFAVMWRFVFAFITTFAFYPMLEATNWGCWLLLIIPLLFTAAFMQKYMPETRNKSVNEILAEMNNEEYAGTTFTPLVEDDRELSDYGSLAGAPTKKRSSQSGLY